VIHSKDDNCKMNITGSHSCAPSMLQLGAWEQGVECNAGAWEGGARAMWMPVHELLAADTELRFEYYRSVTGRAERETLLIIPSDERL
jgi:hypothetical protein